LALKREDGGKIRVASMLREDARVILKREVLDIRNVGGSLHIAQKVRHHDDLDPPTALYNLYGPSQSVVEDDVDFADGAPRVGVS
jgi:hypothetical protein